MQYVAVRKSFHTVGRWQFAFFIRMHFREIVALTTSSNRVRHILSRLCRADHNRPRTRNTRPINEQCTTTCISKSHTFSMRMSILLLASVILAPNRKYTTRHFSQCNSWDVTGVLINNWYTVFDMGRRQYSRSVNEDVQGL